MSSTAIPADVWRYNITPLLSPLDAARLRACNRFFDRVIPDIAEGYRNRFVSGVMLEAAGDGHIDVVMLMIRKGANNWNGGLNTASMGGWIELVKLMIENGATNQSEGLYWAKRFGHTDIAEYLRKVIAERGF